MLVSCPLVRSAVLVLFLSLVSCTGSRGERRTIDPCAHPEPSGDAVTKARALYRICDGTTYEALPRARYTVVDTFAWPGFEFRAGHIVLLRTATGDTLRMHAGACCTTAPNGERLAVGQSYELDLVRVDFMSTCSRADTLSYVIDGRRAFTVPGTLYYSERICGLRLRDRP